LERGGWSVAVGAWRLERGGWSVVNRGLADHHQRRSNRHAPTVKPEASSAVARS